MSVFILTTLDITENAEPEVGINTRAFELVGVSSAAAGSSACTFSVSSTAFEQFTVRHTAVHRVKNTVDVSQGMTNRLVEHSRVGCRRVAIGWIFDIVFWIGQDYFIWLVFLGDTVVPKGESASCGCRRRGASQDGLIKRNTSRSPCSQGGRRVLGLD